MADARAKASGGEGKAQRTRDVAHSARRFTDADGTVVTAATVTETVSEVVRVPTSLFVPNCCQQCAGDLVAASPSCVRSKRQPRSA